MSGSCFIVLSQPRSGTHLLRSYLNCHPSIRCLDEIFSLFHSEDLVQDIPSYVSGRKVLHALSKKLSASTWGFIVHDHQSPENSRNCWSHESILTLEQKPKLIWLHRKNEMARIASLLIASKTNIWRTRRVGKATKDFCLTPDPKEICDTLSNARQKRKYLRRIFSDFEQIEITYEDLCENSQTTMNRVFGFLGYDPTPITTPLAKQRRYRIPRVFSNYNQIVEEIAKASDLDQLTYESSNSSK